MDKVLILFAHPALQSSRVNRRLVEAVKGIEGVTLRDLYEAYPDFDVDVPHEQSLLERHDLIVLQHPFYWY
ncbi:MAG: NAD(P)H-dependent oxidoreductase, partial [Acidobacteriota bacterium]